MRAAAARPIGRMTHSWLITGPPGSGRSNLAYAFAAALLARAGRRGGDRAPGGGSHASRSRRAQHRARHHLASTRCANSSPRQFSPSRRPLPGDGHRGRRPDERAHLQRAAQGPRGAAVAHGLDPVRAERGGPDPDHPLARSQRAAARAERRRRRRTHLPPRRRRACPTATRAAREAQSHIGMAHRLATNERGARAAGAARCRLALGIRTVGGRRASRRPSCSSVAGDDAKAITEERDAEEREGALRSLGIEPGGTIPPALRAQLKALEEDQKRRATRSLRDGLDRILVDLLSLYRDILLLQLGVEIEPVNLAIYSELAAAARLATPARTLETLDAIAEARVANRRERGSRPGPRGHAGQCGAQPRDCSCIVRKGHPVNRTPRRLIVALAVGLGGRASAQRLRLVVPAADAHQLDLDADRRERRGRSRAVLQPGAEVDELREDLPVHERHGADGLERPVESVDQARPDPPAGDRATGSDRCSSTPAAPARRATTSSATA